PGPRIEHLRRAFIPIVLFAALASCEDGSGAAEPDGEVSARIVSGGQQEGVAGRALPQPVVVEVRDADGALLAGHPVSWQAGDGGAIEPASGTTGANGTAGAVWRLGPGEGAQSASVTAERASALP